MAKPSEPKYEAQMQIVFEDGRTELYNLQTDIGESKDLAKQMPRKAMALQRALASWRESVRAKMPTVNPDYDPEKAHLWKRRPRPQKKK